MDNVFDIKMIVKSYAIKIIFKSRGLFWIMDIPANQHSQPSPKLVLLRIYQLSGKANPALFGSKMSS